jgi:hypothetical protein
MAGQQRKLKAEGSNPEAPDKKSHKGSEDAAEDDNFDESDVKGMFKALIHEMRSVKGAVESARNMAEEAKKSALEAKDAAAIAKNEVGKLQNDMKELKDKGIRAEVEKILKGSATTSGNSYKQAAVEESGKKDKWRRTVAFGPFPEDTRSDDIVKFMEEALAEYTADLEEVYAYGKEFAEKGGARFKTEEAMWTYMRARSGKHVHDYEGVHVYCNVDNRSKNPDSDDSLRERAVRKVVRAIIETSGGDSNKTKAEIDTNYKKGIVWWKEQRVATWQGGKMELLGAAAPWKARFATLFKSE